MKKDLFYIGRFSVHGYGLMIGIGFILALFLGIHILFPINYMYPGAVMVI